VDHNLNSLFTDLRIIQLADGVLSGLLSFKLNITKSSTFTVGVNFEFTRFDITERFEHVIQFFLVSFFWQISNQNVGLTIESTCFVLFSIKDNASIINGSIIHFSQTSISLLLGIEVKITKAF
jgi:hypothetical protein